MKQSLLFVLVVFCCANPTSAQQFTPQYIVKEARKAAINITDITYEGEQIQSGNTYSYKVIQKRSDVSEIGLGRGLLNVNGIKTDSNSDETAFGFTYDGETFKFLNISKNQLEVIEDPNAKKIGRKLGFEFFSIINAHFLKDDPFGHLLEENIELVYSGIVELENGNAHKILAHRAYKRPDSDTLSISTSGWYFDTNTYFLLKFETAYQTNSYYNLVANSNIKMADLTIGASNGLEEKIITGNEANIEGLLTIGSLAPDFELKTPNGESFRLSDQSNITVLDFWGVWCIPCRKVMPELQELHETYSPLGVSVIGISNYDSEGTPEDFYKKKGFNYGLLLNGETMNDLFNVEMFPTIYVIDQNQKVLYAEQGARENAIHTIETVIKETISKRGN